MPIDTKHPDYVKMAPAWLMMRRLAGGQRLVHAAGVEMLPKLTEETDDDYNARRARTPFFNATWRTIEALVGMLFRKDPEVQSSTAIEQMLKDVTKSGEPFPMFAAKVAEEFEIVGRVGVLVDHPRAPAVSLTKKNAEALNIRPHLALYRAESIINWRYDWINERSQLGLLVLEECAPAAGKDKYEHTTVEQWRELELVDHPAGGKAYQITVWQRGDGNGKFVKVGDSFFPTMDSKPIPEIPFEMFGDGLPPLEDLGHVNISHYQTTADLEHGAHKTALPTPYVTGNVQREIDAAGRPIPLKLYLGGGSGLVIPGKDIQIGMLEFTGAGLTSLENRGESKEKQMAILGARMLEQQKRGVESGESAGIHRSGEQSTLQAQAARLSVGFSRVLSWFEQWAGGPGDVVVNVNRDFMPANMSAQEITAVMAAYQAQGISPQEKFERFQRGGLIRDGKTYEEHESEITNATPPLLADATTTTEEPIEA